MPAELIPHARIPELAEQIESLAMLRILQHLQKAAFVLNGQDVSPAVADVLGRLADLGLVDVGYEGEAREPAMWVGNGNGSRVLRYFLSSPRLQEALASSLDIHPRAQTALAALDEWGQAKALSAAEAIQRRDPATWESDEAVQLRAGEPVYLLRVSPEMRAFIRVVGKGKVELLDLVREETLQMFHERQRTAGVPQ